jgi:AbrB family looped-hinge helix DNA binding protein
MENYISSISSKGQTTIPVEIRNQLSLNAGDKIGFIVENGSVKIQKIPQLDMEYLKALDNMFSEWNDPGDSAYDNL